MDNIYWIAGAAIFGAVIILIARISGKNSPAKKIRIRKLVAVWLILLASSLLIFKPYVSPHSRTAYLDELIPDNLDSSENLVKFEKEQTLQIERLKTEVEDLRSDLYEANSYNGFVNQFYLTIITMSAIYLAFRKRDAEDSE